MTVLTVRWQCSHTTEVRSPKLHFPIVIRDQILVFLHCFVIWQSDAHFLRHYDGAIEADDSQRTEDCSWAELLWAKVSEKALYFINSVFILIQFVCLRLTIANKLQDDVRNRVLEDKRYKRESPERYRGNLEWARIMTAAYGECEIEERSGESRSHLSFPPYRVHGRAFEFGSSLDTPPVRFPLFSSLTYSQLQFRHNHISSFSCRQLRSCCGNLW